jgi:hypothetical protein
MTDRAKIKEQQEGTYVTAADISDAKDAVASMHARPIPFVMSRTTANEFTEFPMGFAPHAARAKKVGIQVAANIASDNTDYVVFKFFHRTNGTSTLYASWNTHGGAQGALTTAGPGVISSAATGLVVNSDANIPANAGLQYSVVKAGDGKVVNAHCVLTPWLEEV